MAKRTQSYGLNNPLQDVFPVPVVSDRAPTVNDTQYELGQQWVDQSASQIYGLATVTQGEAGWSLLGDAASDLSTLTGDAGGAISPMSGNINILGGAGLTVTGAASTLTITNDTPEVETLTGDTGGALSPTSGNINIVGGTGLSVAGSGSTLTATPDLITLTGDSGGGIPPDGSSTINIVGAGGLSVAGAGSTLTITNDTADVETLTGDTGGAISPTTGNINIVGGSGLTVAGSGSTLTITNDTEGGFPVTPYVVGSPGSGIGFSTIQLALNAANADMAGIVVVQPGTYTEDLTLFDGIHLIGLTLAAAGGGVIINGTHTPPPTGGVVLQNLRLVDAAAILSSAVAGSAHLIMSDVEVIITNGFMVNLVNWTGTLEFFNVNGRGGTNEGAVNNTGGAEILAFSSTLGAGTTVSMVTSGSFTCNSTEFVCPIDCQTGTVLELVNALFRETLTLSNNTIGNITSSSFKTGGNTSLTMSTSADIQLEDCVIDTGAGTAIGGAGAGTLNLTGINFTDVDVISASVTLSAGITSTGTFKTLDATTGLEISANTISAEGSATDIFLILSAKGANAVQVTSNLTLTTPGNQFRMEGGAVTDFIGRATLTAGTVTVANTGIASTDRIFITRAGVGASTSLGGLMTTIVPSTSFVITSVQLTSPGSTQTGDASTVDYIIIRQL